MVASGRAALTVGSCQQKFTLASVDMVLSLRYKSIIRDELSFRVIEGERFKDYSHLLELRFVIPSRITV